MRISVLPLFGIGDVLMTTPALRRLKEQGDVHITYLHMFKTTRQVLDENPNVDENVHFPFIDAGRLKGLMYLHSLRGKFDASINFYPSNRRDYTLAAFIAGAPLRYGHRYMQYDLRELNFLKNRTRMEDDGLHNVQENLRLVEMITGAKEGFAEEGPLELLLTKAECDLALSWLEDHGLAGREVVGLHPGTSAFKDQHLRRWPKQKFAELIKELAYEDHDKAFILFGGPEEAGLRADIIADTGLSKRVISAELGSIRQSAALIARCGRFVSNDSGLMHVAASLQVPTVALFGPTNPAYVHPWMCPHKVVRNEGCGPCFRYSPAPLKCPEDEAFNCIRDITVAQVVDAFDSLESKGISSG